MTIFLMILVTALVATTVTLYTKLQNEKKASVMRIEHDESEFLKLERDLQAARSGRHDLKNHLLTIKGLVEQVETQQAVEYLDQLIESSNRKQSVSCGNAVVDSILREKANVMKSQDIIFRLESSLPRRLNLNSSQMTGILANLLDNAITAAAACEFRYVDLKLNHSKGSLVMMIKNPYVGEVLKKGERYLSTKTDGAEHGIGLQTVQKTIERLGGSCEIEHENNVFSVFVMVSA